MRVLTKRKLFAFVAIATLGLGIGVNTAIFSVVNAVLLTPLPYGNVEESAVIWRTTLPTRSDRLPESVPNFQDLREQNHAFEQLADLRLEHVGFVFQAYNLIPVLSARENVEFVMELQGVSAEKRHELSRGILAEVGLTGMEDRRPAELSGGQQQRVAVARAIVSHPTIVLADEPTANLDSQTARELVQLMRTLNEKHQTTFVISTHDPMVIEMAPRRIGLRDGRIVSDQAAH